MIKKFLSFTVITLVLTSQTSFASPKPSEKIDINLQIKRIVEKTLYEILPKNTLITLKNFSEKFSYDFSKGGLQEIYLSAHSNGEETFFGATNISAKSFKTEELTSESIETTEISTENIHSQNGLTVIDSFDNQKYCLTVYKGNIVSNSGSC